MPIYTNDPCDDGVRPFGNPLYSSVGIGPKVTKAIDAATKEWLDDHPEATTTVEDNSITNIKLKSGSVNSRAIEDGSVSTDDIADLAITTPKIADGAVTGQKLAGDAIYALPTMSVSQPGVAKVGAGLAVNNGALELSGGDIAPAVTAWLNAHPEATTTVQDGSVTDAKLVQTGGVLDKVDSIFDTVDIPVSVRSISGATAYEGYNGFVSSNVGIGLNTSTPNMDSYVVIATEDIDIWFDDITTVYMAIVYGSNYTTTYAGEGYYIVYCSDPTRLRSADENLPTAESKLHITAGSAVCFTIRQGTDQLVYGLAGKGFVIKESFADNVLAYAPADNKDKVLVQHKASPERLSVSVPTNVGYVTYDLYHVNSDTINADIWHMGFAYSVTDELMTRSQLTTGGEWEIAIHLSGRDDFSGGSAHGDQILIGNPIFMIDGKIVSTSDLATMKECNEFVVLQTSNMYDPADHETVIAIEACQHRWTRDGLEVRQSLLWQGDYTLTSSYLAMFPPAKAQTDYAYLDSDMTAHAVIDVYGEHENAQWACIYGASNGVRMEFWVDEYPNASGKLFLMTDNSGGAYNKCYFYAAKGSLSNPPQVTNGTLWKSVTHYHIEVGE